MNARKAEALAEEQTLLSNERTMLAHIRTALTSLLTGLALIKLFANPAAAWGGFALVVLSLVFLVIGVMYYAIRKRNIKKLP